MMKYFLKCWTIFYNHRVRLLEVGQICAGGAYIFLTTIFHKINGALCESSEISTICRVLGALTYGESHIAQFQYT